MLITIKCPTCGAESTLALLKPYYEGPYSCWKCHVLLAIKTKDGKLESWKPLSREELQKRQDAEALKAKLKQRLPRND